jgi:filamentous hemagglutinin
VFGNDGSLSAFRVSRGTIRLEGNGLDAGNLEGVDLLARAVQLNAGLWARQVNVVTGANQIDAQTLATQAITGEGERPQFGLDVAALGGMQGRSGWSVPRPAWACAARARWWPTQATSS